jgi:hypothetical protein
MMDVESIDPAICPVNPFNKVPLSEETIAAKVNAG